MKAIQTANQLSGRAIGALFFAGFGALWLLLALYVREQLHAVPASGEALPHALHDAQVVSQIVDRVQRARERLAGLHQVAQIGARVAPADHARAGWVGRALVLGVAFCP
jgi:hypothetical protein